MQDLSLEAAKVAARGVLCTLEAMVEHVLIEAVIYTVVAVVLALLFRRETPGMRHLAEYLIGAVLGGIILVILFCEVILR